MMDIKGIVRQVIPFTSEARRAESAQSTRSKTDASGDREGSGQAAEEEKKKRIFTPEEIQDLVKYLEGLPGVKDNGLTVRYAADDGINVIYVEESSGKIVRRIPESDFGALMANRQKKSGNLLNRAL